MRGKRGRSKRETIDRIFKHGNLVNLRENPGPNLAKWSLNNVQDSNLSRKSACKINSPLNQSFLFHLQWKLKEKLAKYQNESIPCEQCFCLWTLWYSLSPMPGEERLNGLVCLGWWNQKYDSTFAGESFFVQYKTFARGMLNEKEGNEIIYIMFRFPVKAPIIFSYSLSVTIFTWPIAVWVTGMLFVFCGFVSCDESVSLRHLVRKSTNALLFLSIFLWSSHVTHCYKKVTDVNNNDK